jgi:hypothetical protein
MSPSGLRACREEVLSVAFGFVFETGADSWDLYFSRPAPHHAEVRRRSAFPAVCAAALSHGLNLPGKFKFNFCDILSKKFPSPVLKNQGT